MFGRGTMSIKLKVKYDLSDVNIKGEPGEQIEEQKTLHLYGLIITNGDYDVICQDEVNVGNTLFLVIARYTNGNAFKKTTGQAAFLGAFKKLEDAEFLQESVYSSAGSFIFTHSNEIKEKIESVWSHYREELEYVQINELEVLNEE